MNISNSKIRTNRDKQVEGDKRCVWGRCYQMSVGRCGGQQLLRHYNGGQAHVKSNTVFFHLINLFNSFLFSYLF